MRARSTVVSERNPSRLRCMNKIISVLFSCLLVILLPVFAYADVESEFKKEDCAAYVGHRDAGTINNVDIGAVVPSYALPDEYMEFYRRCDVEYPIADASPSPGAPVPDPAPIDPPASTMCEYFLTFRAWYCGLPVNPDTGGFVVDGESGLTVFVWIIILNILVDLFSVVGYLALGFVIYAGYLYVLARGDSSRIAKGKKTLLNAIIGLIISILASMIVALVSDIVSGAVS